MKFEIEVPQKALDLCEKEGYEIIGLDIPKIGEKYVSLDYDEIITCSYQHLCGFRLIVKRKHRKPEITHIVSYSTLNKIGAVPNYTSDNPDSWRVEHIVSSEPIHSFEGFQMFKVASLESGQTALVLGHWNDGLKKDEEEPVKGL